LTVWCYLCDDELCGSTTPGQLVSGGPNSENVSFDKGDQLISSEDREISKFLDGVQDLFFQFFNGTLFQQADERAAIEKAEAKRHVR